MRRFPNIRQVIGSFGDARIGLQTYYHADDLRAKNELVDFDLRSPVATGRPTSQRAEPGLNPGKVMGDHGSPPWPAINIYHNTFVMAGRARRPTMGVFSGTGAGKPRRVFNNVFLHFEPLPAYFPPDAEHGLIADGNFYWSKADNAFRGNDGAAAFFERFRKSPGFKLSRQSHAAGSTTHSLAADPMFIRPEADSSKDNDYGLSPGSPAVNAGVGIPTIWPDPLRDADSGRPDVGAVPLGGEFVHVGRTLK